LQSPIPKRLASNQGWGSVSTRRLSIVPVFPRRGEPSRIWSTPIRPPARPAAVSPCTGRQSVDERAPARGIRGSPRSERARPARRHRGATPGRRRGPATSRPRAGRFPMEARAPHCASVVRPAHAVCPLTMRGRRRVPHEQPCQGGHRQPRHAGQPPEPSAGPGRSPRSRSCHFGPRTTAAADDRSQQRGPALDRPRPGRPRRLAEGICARADRELTKAEWIQYVGHVPCRTPLANSAVSMRGAGG